MRAIALIVTLSAALTTSPALQAAEGAELAALIEDVTPRVVAWRRDIHAHPELGNREFRTAALVAEHLEGLGMDVETNVAHTGVVGVLRGGRPGPVVGLRADMDALPVAEQVDLPFASKVRTDYNGQEVGVMHACGHDNHVAILMGVAEVLAAVREDLPGTVKFIFQPAEEGPPAGEDGGAALMVAEGVLNDPQVDAVFGLHVFPFPVGTVGYRSGGLMASSDSFSITVRGRQTHGAVPWGGIDPIVVASQIVLGLQTIPSRQLDATLTPSIVTVGAIHGGVRSNIIPEEVEMIGTLRTFDRDTRTQIHERLTRTATRIADAAGATAEVRIDLGTGVTYNDPELTRRMLPTLQAVAGGGAIEVPRTTTAEDFSVFQENVPGLFVFLGVAPEDPALVHPNHSPRFYADERALPLGVEVITRLAVDYLEGE